MSGNLIGFSEEIKKLCQKMCYVHMLIWSADTTLQCSHLLSICVAYRSDSRVVYSQRRNGNKLQERRGEGEWKETTVWLDRSALDLHCVNFLQKSVI